MTQSAKTTIDAKTNQINYCTRIQAPPEAVYDLFATADGLDSWFCTGSVVDLENKHIEYRWKDWGAKRVSMSTSGAILEASRPHRFVFQWGQQPSTIEFEFKPKDGGTYMTVLEYGYDERDGAAKQMMMECASGWGEALSLAKFYLEHGCVAKHPWPWKECKR
jgi:uncharacterized protein YndB with AHSA1/START domain